MASQNDLVHDWNLDGAPARPASLKLNDETLRDGLQSPSVRDPSIDAKLELLHAMEALQLDAADIGLPGAGKRQVDDAARLATELVREKMKLKPNCAARTHVADIDAVAEVSSRAGVPVEVCCFLGSSPIRLFTEGWTLTDLQRRVEESMRHAVKLGLPATFVTEDTTRSAPASLTALYRTAVDNGATAVVVADTVGHATPFGVQAVVKHVRSVVGPTVRVDFHGHRDRGMDLSNSFAAWLAGADMVHGAALGLGERVGNTPIELLLVNLALLGWMERDLSTLANYCAVAAKATDTVIAPNHPVFGADAFRTATGVHAAALMKAMERNDDWLVDTIYSGVPARLFGAKQRIEVGPMSGKWNVIFWLREQGLDVTEERVAKLLAEAKKADRVLTDDELRRAV